MKDKKEVVRKLNLRLQYELYIKLCTAAKQQGMSVSTFIRKAIEERVEKNQEILDDHSR